MSLFKVASLFKRMSLSLMDRLNGHADPTPKDFPGLISLCKLMGPCSVRLITHSTRRSVDGSAMAPCECSMLHELVIAAPVRCAHSVKNVARASNRDG